LTQEAPGVIHLCLARGLCDVEQSLSSGQKSLGTFQLVVVSLERLPRFQVLFLGDVRRRWREERMSLETPLFQRFLLPLAIYTPIRYLWSYHEPPPYGIKDDRIRNMIAAEAELTLRK